jgi:hypothetical protein
VFAYLDWSSSSVPTQFPDAIQRASYYFPRLAHLAGASVKPTRRLVLNMRRCPPTPTDTTTPMGVAISAGDITTKDISVFLFPNTLVTTPDGG